MIYLNKIINFLCSTALWQFLMTLITSGLAGAWLASRTERKKCDTELKLQKRNYESTISHMEKEHELVIRQKQIEWEHERQLLESASQKSHADALIAAYGRMIHAVTEYTNTPLPPNKTQAQTEIRVFAALVDPTLLPSIDELDNLITHSEPFEGPGEQQVQSAITQIRTLLFQS